MISTKLCVLFIGVIVLIILQTTNAIKCWDCDSYTNKLCGEPFDNRTASIADCSLIAERHKQKCRKMIQTINGVVKYTRGCWIDDHNINQLNEATIELCNTDACNSSTQKLPSILALTFPLSISVALYLRR